MSVCMISQGLEKIVLPTLVTVHLVECMERYLQPVSNKFLDSRPWPEGFYEIESVLPSVRPSVLSGSFLGIGSLVFSETWYGVRGPYGDVWQISIFFEKSSAKNDQKCQKMTPKFFIFIFQENLFIRLAWQWCGMKVLMTF